MKRIGIVMSFIAVMAIFMLPSCHKPSNNPVDQYVEILEDALKKVEKIQSMDDLLELQEIIAPQAAVNLIEENADYVLTSSDKDKIKKVYDKLLKTGYEKTAEYGGFPEAMKEHAKSQVDLLIDIANQGIDKAHTLGELNGIR